MRWAETQEGGCPAWAGSLRAGPQNRARRTADHPTEHSQPMAALNPLTMGGPRLLETPDQSTAMAEAARRAAQTRFCASKIVPLYERFYEDILSGSAAANG